MVLFCTILLFIFCVKEIIRTWQRSPDMTNDGYHQYLSVNDHASKSYLCQIGHYHAFFVILLTTTNVNYDHDYVLILNNFPESGEYFYCVCTSFHAKNEHLEK